MTIKEYISIKFRQIKSVLSDVFKFNKIKRKNNVLKHSKNDLKIIKKELEKIGFSRIKNYSIGSWKCYENGKYLRVTLCALYKGNKVFIKVGKNFDKVDNSIAFQKIFNGKLDFIPSGEEIIIPGYSCYITEFIDCYSFYEFEPYFKNHIGTYLDKIIEILKIFDKYKLVHCDLETYNIIFRKKDYKMFLIDFDTCQSKLLNLATDNVPETIVHKVNGKVVFDDAYSFYTIIERLKINGIDKNKKYLELESLVGNNTFCKNS